MRVVTHPMRELVQTVRAVKAGNYRARATVRTKDEVGELAVAFNDMVVSLQQKEAANHQLLRKIIAAVHEAKELEPS